MKRNFLLIFCLIFSFLAHSGIDSQSKIKNNYHIRFSNVHMSDVLAQLANLYKLNIVARTDLLSNESIEITAKSAPDLLNELARHNGLKSLSI